MSHCLLHNFFFLAKCKNVGQLDDAKQEKKGGWPMPFGSTGSSPFGPRVTQNLFSGFAVNCDWFVRVVSYVLTRAMKDIFFF